MITQEFLQSCTDEQIDLAVAWTSAYKLGIKSPCEFMSYGRGYAFKDNDYCFSPCTNPNDAWPIILENKISLLHGDIEADWEASIDYQGTLEEDGIDEMLSKWVAHKNPLRAAMEVYILMSTQS